MRTDKGKKIQKMREEPTFHFINASVRKIDILNIFLQMQPIKLDQFA